MVVKRRLACAVALIAVPIAAVVWACGGYGVRDSRDTSLLISDLGNVAYSNVELANHFESDAMIRELRRRGPESLDAILQYRAMRLAEGEYGPDDPTLARIDWLVDRIAGQKFATQSKLFWHTSLTDAVVEAQKTNRPVLSLRMLGRLDEDLSCANSRYFRTLLYPDPEIAKRLRQQFVLHWQPVRSVPVVTIDFGDGRKLQKPLTGNSVHLVLSRDGHPIDAMPGLVTPPAFLRWLGEATDLHAQWSDDMSKNWEAVAAYHHRRAEKRRNESELATTRGADAASLDPLDPRWNQLASSFVADAISNESIALIESQQPKAAVAMPIAATKSIAETPLLRNVQPIAETLAQDTAFNLYGLQVWIDDWFESAIKQGNHAQMGYDALTRTIYADAFRMPLDDPWLGLSPEAEFAALDNGGRIEPALSTAAKASSDQNASLVRKRDVDRIARKGSR